MASKIMLARISASATSALLPRQFGVGVKGGLDAVVHIMRNVHDNPWEGDICVLQVDLANAFNNVDRGKMLEQIELATPAAARFAHLSYGRHTNLYFDGSEIITSASGVQQGDPSGPVYFALALKPVDDAIQAASGIPVTANYADDLNYAGSPPQAQIVWDVLTTQGPPRGFHVNARKCKNITIQGEAQKLGDLEPEPSSNLVVLGSPVGDAEFTAKHVQRVFARADLVLEALPKLGDGQTGLLLLRNYASYCRCVQMMRTVPPHLITSIARVFDGKQRKCLEDILHTSLPVAAWQQAQLGVRLGGLGLRSVEAHAEAAFVGCLESNKWVSEQIKLALLSNANISWDGVALNQSKRSAALDQVMLAKLVASSSLIDQRRLVAIQRKHANAFLMACPRRFLGCEFTDSQFRVSVQRWLGVPIMSDMSRQCGKCAKLMSPRATHATRCLKKGDITRRHNRVRDLLKEFGSMACMSHVLEKANLIGEAPGRALVTSSPTCTTARAAPRILQ